LRHRRYRVDASLARQDDEPAIALCGIDNAFGRRALDRVGFPFVVEAGLGRGHRDFRTIRMHTLPGSRPAAEIWKSGTQGDDVSDRSAYRCMLQDGELDQCGITLLAGKAVGAPLVGAGGAKGLNSRNVLEQSGNGATTDVMGGGLVRSPSAVSAEWVGVTRST
jgi:hypothetical protein